MFSKEIAYRVYDEFDESQIEYQENGDLIACAEMPVDTWLIVYLLSFGAYVEIIEPTYLKAVLYWRSKRPTAQYKVMRTTAQGNMPLCGCGWRDTHGRFHLS